LSLTERKKINSTVARDMTLHKSEGTGKLIGSGIAKAIRVNARNRIPDIAVIIYVTFSLASTRTIKKITGTDTMKNAIKSINLSPRISIPLI